MLKEEYIAKLLQRIDEILMEEAKVRAKLRASILELSKTLNSDNQKKATLEMIDGMMKADFPELRDTNGGIRFAGYNQALQELRDKLK